MKLIDGLSEIAWGIGASRGDVSWFIFFADAKNQKVATWVLKDCSSDGFIEIDGWPTRDLYFEMAKSIEKDGKVRVSEMLSRIMEHDRAELIATIPIEPKFVRKKGTASMVLTSLAMTGHIFDSDFFEKKELSER